MIHLPPLPYSTARVEFHLESYIERAVREARILEEEGFTGVIVENFGDAPYRKRVEDPLALATFTLVAREVVKSTSIPVGLNLLRNSGLEAYSVAYAIGAKFIRINALVETLVSDSGLIEPEAPRLRDVRRNYPGVRVYADVLVKHGTSLYAALSLVEAQVTSTSSEDVVRAIVLDYVERGGADALVVTGPRTGEPPDTKLLSLVKRYSTVPVLVGSGARPENLRVLLEHSDGVIVGSYIRRGEKAGGELDRERARRFVSEFEAVCQQIEPASKDFEASREVGPRGFEPRTSAV